jgi:hypothetical protein
MPRKRKVTAYFWTEARLTEMATLREAGMAWDDIAIRMGRDSRRCQYALSISRMKTKTQRRKSKPWTTDEDNLLWKCREVDHKRWKQTSEIVGRDVNACTSRMERLKRLRRSTKAGNFQIEDPRVDSEGLSRWVAHCEALRARSPIAQILGDPPPGFSALDQKRREGLTS